MGDPAANGDSYIDVLIIGGGPAGVMGALALARAGVQVRIVDKRDDRVRSGHADGIWPRTLEVFQSYGILDRFQREGADIRLVSFWNADPDGKMTMTACLPEIQPEIGARYPSTTTLHQGAIEQIFLDELAKLGVVVERNTRPLDISISDDPEVLKDPHAHPVKVPLQKTGGNESEVVHAKFALAADGARSWTRDALGVGADSEDTEYVWGVIDFVPGPATDFPGVRQKSYVFSQHGSCLLIPRERDLVRVYKQLDSKAVLDAQGLVDRKLVSPEHLMKDIQKSFGQYHIQMVGEPEWWSAYRIRQGVAKTFSVKDRVFVAGDAGHTHSPKAGQGMNASMNDSHNLGWKIAHVLRGWADMSLLKTYDFERRKYAQDLIAFDKIFAALMVGSKLMVGSETKSEDADHKPSPMDFVRACVATIPFVSGLTVQYAPSAIVDTTHQACAPGILIGRRLPPQNVVRAADGLPVNVQDLLPADSRFKLLVFAGTVRGDALDTVADTIQNSLHGVLGGAGKEAVDVVTIVKGHVFAVDYMSVPASLRPHWSKVFVDSVDASGEVGGKAYKEYGIDDEGVLVVVRPDGYVGIVLPLAEARALDDYFASFSRKSL